MTRSFWIFEAFLAVAGVLAGLIFHCIFKFYVNPPDAGYQLDLDGVYHGRDAKQPALESAGFPDTVQAFP